MQNRASPGIRLLAVLLAGTTATAVAAGAGPAGAERAAALDDPRADPRLRHIERRLEQLGEQIKALRRRVKPLGKKVEKFEKRIRKATARHDAAEAAVRVARLDLEGARRKVHEIRTGLLAEVEGSPEMLEVKRRWNSARIDVEERRAEILEAVHAGEEYEHASIEAEKMRRFLRFLEDTPGFTATEIEAARKDAERWQAVGAELEAAALEADEDYQQASQRVEAASVEMRSLRDAAPPIAADSDYRRATQQYAKARDRYEDAERKERSARAALAAATAAYLNAPPPVPEIRRELLALRRNLERLTDERERVLQQRRDLAPSTP